MLNIHSRISVTSKRPISPLVFAICVHIYNLYTSILE